MFTQTPARALALAISTALFPSLSQSDTLFNSAYTFGDSLSDTGNLGLRFSDGNVTVENVAHTLGLQMTPSQDGGNNFAVGGNTGEEIYLSVTSATTYPPDGPGDDQSTYFMRTQGKADPKALYMVIGGGNDAKYVVKKVTDPDKRTPLSVAEKLVGSANALGGYGAKYIIMLNTPDVGDTPGGPGYLDGSAIELTAASVAINKNTKDLVEKSPHNILLLNLNRLFQEVQRDPAAYGFVNLTAENASKTCMIKGLAFVSCGDEQDNFTITGNPQESIFWDGLHPTSVMHKVTSDFVLSAISAAPQIGSLPKLGASHAQVLDESILTELSQHRWDNSEAGSLGFFGGVSGVEQQIRNGVTQKDEDSKGAFAQAGLHYQATEQIKLGAAIQGGETKYEPQSSSFKTTSVGGSVFANFRREAFFSDLTIDYFDLDYDNSRNFSLGTLQRKESSSTKGKLYGFNLDAGYALYDDGNLRAGPIVTGNYHKITIDVFEESGNSSTAMAFGEQEVDIKTLAGGVFLDAQDQQLRFGLQVDYIKDLEDDDVRTIDLKQKQMSRMAYLPADTSNLDAWRMQVRLGYQLSQNATLYGSYQFVKPDDYPNDNQSIHLGVSWKL